MSTEQLSWSTALAKFRDAIQNAAEHSCAIYDRLMYARSLPSALLTPEQVNVFDRYSSSLNSNMWKLDIHYVESVIHVLNAEFTDSLPNRFIMEWRHVRFQIASISYQQWNLLLSSACGRL